MSSSISRQCEACITTLKRIVSSLSTPEQSTAKVSYDQVNEELERLSLWIGNIGALHPPKSLMSLETRLREVSDVQSHICGLLNDLNEVADDLLEIVSAQREGQIDVIFIHGSEGNGDECGTVVVNEESELLGEIGDCISRLTRVSGLIRQAAPTDLFLKALSRNRYRFNDQFDIAHVGEKFPKLVKESVWLQQRLGRAITQRRHYLSYIQEHRNKLAGSMTPASLQDSIAGVFKFSGDMQPLDTRPSPDSASRPSTFFTKASTLGPGRITPQMLIAEDNSDLDNDAGSFTTLARSLDVDLDSAKVPKLDELRKGSRKEIECPFCFRIKKFRNERVWRRHVFSDLRSYVCTFPECDAPYFEDINTWFQHELQTHRVSYLCRLCKGKNFFSKERYLGHVRRQHADSWEDGQENSLLEIARKPLEKIFAQDCPCCNDWVDRLHERAISQGLPTHTSSSVVTVLSADFKRHLASHLEQLALFAVPVRASLGNDANSNVAIEEDADRSLRGSTPVPLTFESPMKPSKTDMDDIDNSEMDKQSPYPTHAPQSNHEVTTSSNEASVQNPRTHGSTMTSKILPTGTENVLVERTDMASDFLHVPPQLSSSMNHRTSILSHRPNISSAINDAPPKPYDTGMMRTATQTFTVNNPTHDTSILVVPKTQDLEKIDDSAIPHGDEIVEESTDGVGEIQFSCSRCDKKFQQLHLYNQHLVVEHRQPSHLEKLSPLISDDTNLSTIAIDSSWPSSTGSKMQSIGTTPPIGRTIKVATESEECGIDKTTVSDTLVPLVMKGNGGEIQYGRLSDLCEAFISYPWHPMARTLDSFITPKTLLPFSARTPIHTTPPASLPLLSTLDTPNSYTILHDTQYSIPVYFGFGAILYVKVHALRVQFTTALYHEHVIYPWPPDSPVFSMHKHSVLPVVLIPAALATLPETLDAHISNLVVRQDNFRSFPLYTSPLRVLREVYVFYGSLPENSTDSKILHQALKLLVLVHIGGDLTLPSPSSDPYLLQIVRTSMPPEHADIKPTPCFLRAQFGAVMPKLALQLMESTLSSLEQIFHNPEISDWPVTLAALMVLLMTIESIQYHAAKRSYHHAYDNLPHPEQKKEEHNNDRDVDSLLNPYYACFSKCHARLHLELDGDNESLRLGTPEEKFVNNLRQAIRNVNVSGDYLAMRASAERQGDDMGFFFDRLLAQFLLFGAHRTQPDIAVHTATGFKSMSREERMKLPIL